MGSYDYSQSQECCSTNHWVCVYRPGSGRKWYNRKKWTYEPVLQPDSLRREISHQNRSSTRPIADSLSTPENACHYEATFYFAIHKPTIICIPAIRKVCLRSRRRLPHCRLQMAPSSQRRLTQLLNELKETPGSIGNLRLGDITYEIPASLQPSRLARSSNLLDINDPVNLDNLHFLLQKYLLGQDIFLVSQPGPYARRLALTFAR